MALIPCYECGKEISSAAPACPQCGAPKERVAVAASAMSPVPPPMPEAASATRPATTAISDTVREELVNLTKVGKLAIYAWVIYGFFIPSAVPTAHNPFGVLVGFVCGVVSFRGWFKRRTAKVILNRQSLDGFALHIYLPALWSYAWRSSVVFIPLAFVLGFGTEDSGAIATIIGMWIFPSLFIFDVPFWVRRRLRRKPVEHGESKIEDSRENTARVVAVSAVCVAALTAITISITTQMRQKPESGSSAVSGSAAATVPASSYNPGGFDITADPFIDTTGYALAAAYGANASPVGGADRDILLRFATNGTRWNFSSAPLIRDHFEPKITPRERIENSTRSLAELKGILTAMQSDYQHLSDAGAKETANSIVGTLGGMFESYTQLRQFVVAGDVLRQEKVIEALVTGGLAKRQIAVRMVQRLRSRIGPGVMDKRLEEMISEVDDPTTAILTGELTRQNP